MGRAAERMLVACALALVPGCGRIAFDSTGDAGSGGTGDGGDAASGFCATVTPGYAVCTDFDTGSIMDGWSGSEVIHVGTLGPSTAQVDSPPTSLLSQVGTQTLTTELSVAVLDYDIANASTVELHASLFLPQRPSAPYEIDSINVMLPTVGNFFTDLQINTAGPDLFRQEFVPVSAAGQGFTKPITQITTGAWHQLVMKYDFAMQTYEVTIDGTLESQGTFMYPIAPGMTRVQLGANYVSGASSGAGIYHDNVVLYVR